MLSAERSRKGARPLLRRDAGGLVFSGAGNEQAPVRSGTEKESGLPCPAQGEERFVSGKDTKRRLYSWANRHRKEPGQGHVLAPDSESPPSLRRASAVPSAESLRRALRRVSGAQRGAGPVLCGAAPAQRQSGLAFRTPLRRVLRVSAALSAVSSADSPAHREERSPSFAAQRGREASPYAHRGMYSRPRTLDSVSPTPCTGAHSTPCTGARPRTLDSASAPGCTVSPSAPSGT